jgi:hypothetical protein
MENKVDGNLEKEKKAYEPPAFTRVRLEVRASVLAACFSSPTVSPSGDCQDPFFGCLGPA